MEKRKIINIFLFIIILLNSVMSFSDIEEIGGIENKAELVLVNSESSIKDGSRNIPTDYRIVMVFSKNVSSPDVIDFNKNLISLVDGNNSEIPIEIIPYVSEENEKYLNALEIKVIEGLKKDESYSIKINQGIESEGRKEKTEKDYNINFNTENEILSNKTEESEAIVNREPKQNNDELENEVEIARRQNKIIEENMKNREQDNNEKESNNNFKKPEANKTEKNLIVENNPDIKKNDIKDEKNEKKKNPIKFFLILAILVLIIIVIVFIVNKMNKEKEYALLEKKINERDDSEDSIDNKDEEDLNKKD